MLPRFWPAALSLGWIILAFGVGEALMSLVALSADDGEVRAFAIAAAITIFIGGGMVLATRGRKFEFTFRDAVILTVSAWFVLPVFAALPIVLPPVDLAPVEAYVEMVSALTTTGASVMTGLDGRPPSILLWRSLTQWVGGFGIIGLAIIVLPFLKIGGMQLFRLESSDRSEKTLPRVRTLAQAVARIYLLITVLCFITYLLLGMTPFDALNHALTTVCTGGFSTHDASFEHFDSAALEWAAVVFMIAGGIPFLAYLRAFGRGTFRERVEPQIIGLLIVIGVATLALAAYLLAGDGHDFGTAITETAFNVVSVVTTTGYSSTDYTAWGTFAAVLFFFLAFVGGTSGSTSGGMKILRFQILGATILQQIRRLLFPHIVHPVRYGGRPIADEQIISVGVFMSLYIATFALVALIFAATGLDIVTATSAAAAGLGNVGPGLGPIVGPIGSYASFTDFQQLVFAFAMILGRLEILSVLVLLAPSFYR
ncbi:MAG: TrkH family potassium uptake protein [Bauldia sp.]|nr:TrkH family potassium uptake protein [Bauldia sp.]